MAFTLLALAGALPIASALETPSAPARAFQHQLPPEDIDQRSGAECAWRAGALEARVASLEAGAQAQQATIDRLIDAASHRTAAAGSASAAAAAVKSTTIMPVTRMTTTAAAATAGTTAGAGAAGEAGPLPLSVCIAIPCIPRHLASLRLVLADIAQQTVGL
jgi:hypothetical protein